MIVRARQPQSSTAPRSSVALPPPQDDRADEDLLADARRGDDAAFARLLEAHDPLLRRMVGVLVDHRDTEGVLREGYVKAYRALGRARGEPVAWLGRACYLTALDEIRRRDRRRSGGPGRKPAAEPPAGPAARVPPDQRAVLVLDGLVPAETTAAILATSTTTVGRLRDRAATGAEEVLAIEEEAPSDAFWRELGARLLAERAAPPAPPPRVTPPAPLADAPAAKDPPVAMQRRAPAATRRTTGPDPVEGLALGARRRRTRHARIDARVVALVAAVVVIAAVLVVVIRLGSKAASPVRENSVAEVAARVAEVWDTTDLTASYTRRVAGADGPQQVAYDVARDSSGSYLLQRKDGRRAVSYDAATGTRSERVVAFDGSVSLTTDTGLAAGPPDPSGVDASMPDTELGAALRAMSTVTDREAERATVGGRPAWRLYGSLERTGGGEPNHAELVVDRVRLEPISVELTDGDRVVRSLRFDEVDFTVGSAGPLQVETGGAVPRVVDHGFSRTTLRDAVTAVGDRPLRPTYLPDGYELVDIALDEQRSIVSLHYQRGVQHLTVSTRPARPDAGTDPFHRAQPVRADSASIDTGPFRDVDAHRTMTVDPRPALWGQTATVAFTISGDLTSAQLTRVAESMR
jgi:DNA-directed RNA polymerase specialized sigma24 family protein